MTRAVLRIITGAMLLSLAMPLAVRAQPVDELGSYTLGGVGADYLPSGWRSTLYPRQWAPGFADEQGRALADFSYAGYRYGEEPLPSKNGSLTVDVTAFPFRANNRGTKDATKAIQTAINYVSMRGGGVVYLPPGTYRVAPSFDRGAALSVMADDVVLRGAGRDQTFLLNTSTSMNRKSVIAVRPPVTGRWWIAPAGGRNLAADAFAGSSSVKVYDPGSFSVGDLIVIRTEATPEWVASMGSPFGWNAESMDATTFLRRVTSVSPDGRIGLDIPLRADVLLRDAGTKPNVYLATRHLTGIGIEDLSIGMLEHRGGASLEDDVYESAAIRVTNVVDGWIARVGTYAPPQNRNGYHILSEGIWLNDSRNVTVRDCIVRYPQYRGAGNGNGFLVRGSDNLLERCDVVGARHSYTFAYWHTTGNVVRDSSGAHASLASDFHAWLSAANLVEGMRLDGDWIDATYRYDGTYLQHGPTTSQSVIWNTVGLAPPDRPGYGFPGGLVHSVQWGWGATVGTSGRYFGVITDPGTDGWLADGFVDVAEGVGQGGTLLPTSLSGDQLARRKGGSGYDEPLAHGAVRTPSRDTAAVGGRNWATGETVGVSGAMTWQLGFEVPPGTPITRARLVVYGRSRTAGGSISVYPSASTASPLTQPVAQSTRAASAASAAWVFDVTDLVRESGRADTTRTIGLRLKEGIPGLGVRFVTSEGSAALRPRLELERVSGRVLEAAHVSPASAAVADGDATTILSCDGYGSAITLDLGARKRVTGVGVAYASGDRRFGFAELRTSTDGVTFEPVRGLRGGGETRSLQNFDLDAPVEARYIRIVGYGSSAPTAPYANSFGEIEVYGE